MPDPLKPFLPAGPGRPQARHPGFRTRTKKRRPAPDGTTPSAPRAEHSMPQGFADCEVESVDTETSTVTLKAKDGRLRKYRPSLQQLAWAQRAVAGMDPVDAAAQADFADPAQASRSLRRNKPLQALIEAGLAENDLGMDQVFKALRRGITATKTVRVTHKGEVTEQFEDEDLRLQVQVAETVAKMHGWSPKDTEREREGTVNNISNYVLMFEGMTEAQVAAKMREIQSSRLQNRER